MGHTHSWVGSRDIGGGKQMVTYICECGATYDVVE